MVMAIVEEEEEEEEAFPTWIPATVEPTVAGIHPVTDRLACYPRLPLPIGNFTETS